VKQVWVKIPRKTVENYADYNVSQIYVSGRDWDIVAECCRKALLKRRVNIFSPTRR
jgi:hypothetical protein